MPFTAKSFISYLLVIELIELIEFEFLNNLQNTYKIVTKQLQKSLKIVTKYKDIILIKLLF